MYIRSFLSKSCSKNYWQFPLLIGQLCNNNMKRTFISLLLHRRYFWFLLGRLFNCWFFFLNFFPNVTIYWNYLRIMLLLVSIWDDLLHSICGLWFVWGLYWCLIQPLIWILWSFIKYFLTNFFGVAFVYINFFKFNPLFFRISNIFI